MRTTTSDATVASIKSEIEVIITKHICPRIDESLRLLRFAIRQSFIIANPLLPEDPKKFLRRAAVANFDLWFLKYQYAESRQIRMLISAPPYDWQYLTPVRIANQRCASVWSQIRPYVTEHRAHL